MKKMKVLIAFVLLLVFSFNVNAQEASKIKKGQIVKPTVKFGGRIQYDFEFLKMKDGISPGEDYTFKGQEFRRVYLEVGGKIHENIKYKAQIELAGGEVAYRDMYIQFNDIPFIGGSFGVGSMAEPTGLDMGTSSKYTPFLERAMLTNTQNFRWNSGLHYSNFGILNDKVGLQLSYTFNGNNKQGFIDGHVEEGNHFVARITSPIFQNKEKHQLIHIGFNYEHRKRSNEPADYTLKFRPENHMGDKVNVLFPNLEVQGDVGFELAGNFGSFSLQTEYEMAGYKTKGEDYTVPGYYVAATYFITGERRGYKKGAYDRVKSISRFSFKEKKFGALELVARYSVMDFSDVIGIGNNDKIRDITVGFNWYLSSYARVMYNFTLADFNSVEDNNPLLGNLIRTQIDF